MANINEQYPRVSEILGQWPRFEGIDPLILANKAAIGTAVHAAIRAHQEGIDLPLRDSEQGYYDSYLRWEEEMKPSICAAELSLQCEKFRFRGTVDAIMKIDSSPLPTLIDYKTSVKEDPKFWPAQGAFYCHLAKENNFKIGPEYLFMKLDKKGGKPTVYIYKVTLEVWSFCVAALATYTYRK